MVRAFSVPRSDIALGSDYNIFGIGLAWKEAGTRSLSEALALTLPQSARAIRTAAFALAVGILIDPFVVRSLLAPALLAVMGSLAGPSTDPSDDPQTESLARPEPRPAPEPVEAPAG